MNRSLWISKLNMSSVVNKIVLFDSNNFFKETPKHNRMGIISYRLGSWKQLPAYARSKFTRMIFVVDHKDYNGEQILLFLVNHFEDV